MTNQQKRTKDNSSAASWAALLLYSVLGVASYLGPLLNTSSAQTTVICANCLNNQTPCVLDCMNVDGECPNGDGTYTAYHSYNYQPLPVWDCGKTYSSRTVD